MLEDWFGGLGPGVGAQFMGQAHRDKLLSGESSRALQGANIASILGQEQRAQEMMPLDKAFKTAQTEEIKQRSAKSKQEFDETQFDLFTKVLGSTEDVDEAVRVSGIKISPQKLELLKNPQAREAFLQKAAIGTPAARRQEAQDERTAKRQEAAKRADEQRARMVEEERTRRAITTANIAKERAIQAKLAEINANAQKAPRNLQEMAARLNEQYMQVKNDPTIPIESKSLLLDKLEQDIQFVFNQMYQLNAASQAAAGQREAAQLGNIVRGQPGAPIPQPTVPPVGPGAVSTGGATVRWGRDKDGNPIKLGPGQ